MQLLLHHLRRAALAVCVTTAVACACASTLLVPRVAQAAAADAAVPMKIQDVQSGTLLFKPKSGGDTLAVPRQSTEVTIRVSGIVARAHGEADVSQSAMTTGSRAFTVFPLPENAAVDHLKMRIGDRVVQGEVKEKGRSETNLRAGQSRRPARGVAGAGAAQPVHLERGQHRPAPGNHRRTRIPANVALRQRPVFDAFPDGRSRRVTSPAKSRWWARQARAGRRIPARCPTPRASRRRCR